MNNLFKQWIKQYLSFQKSDRNAILILTAIVLILAVFRIIIEYLPVQGAGYDFSEIEKFVGIPESGETGNEVPKMLFAFNPNLITRSRLDSLDLPEFIKRNLLSYRNAGGHFKSIHDVRKIYGMNDSIFEAVVPFMVIPETEKNIVKNETFLIHNNVEISKPDSGRQNNHTEVYHYEAAAVPDKPVFNIDLNRADSLDLLALKGIGPVYASRILKYRNLLGGFYSREQLKEVYNFQDETYHEIEKFLTVDTAGIHQIRINFAEYKELLRHPYLNEDQVQRILGYRIREGAFRSVGQILEQDLIDSVSFFRIRPYLTCR